MTEWGARCCKWSVDFEARMGHIERLVWDVSIKLAAVYVPVVVALLGYKALSEFWHTDKEIALLAILCLTVLWGIVISKFVMAPAQKMEIIVPASPQPKPLNAADSISAALRGIKAPHRFKPANEAGTVYVFAHYAKEAGIDLLHIGSSFPDATILMDGKPVSIEFEYRSSNFRAHKHDAKKCDLIICWQHDWRDCPLPVVELATFNRGDDHA